MTDNGAAEVGDTGLGVGPGVGPGLCSARRIHRQTVGSVRRGCRGSIKPGEVECQIVGFDRFAAGARRSRLCHETGARIAVGGAGVCPILATNVDDGVVLSKMVFPLRGGGKVLGQPYDLSISHAGRRGHRSSDGCRRGSKGARGYDDVELFGGCHVGNNCPGDRGALRNSPPRCWRRREWGGKR